MLNIKSLSFRFAKQILFVLPSLALLSFDNSHIKVVDDFITKKEWTSQVIDEQNSGPLFNAGVWSDPIKGPTFRTENGKGIFHFPKLESWILEGFELDYRTITKTNEGIKLFSGTNYLTFNVQNKSSEPVFLKFRCLDNVSFTYHNPNGITHEDALAELVNEPDTFRIMPNLPVQKIRLKLNKPILKDPLITNPVYVNQIKIFEFEVHRTEASSKRKPTIDCTLIMDHLQIEDETENKK